MELQFLYGLRISVIQVVKVIMESIVYSISSYLEEKIDQLCQYLTIKFMMFNGYLMVQVLLLYQDCNQLQQLYSIQIAKLCLNLAKDIEIQ